MAAMAMAAVLLAITVPSAYADGAESDADLLARLIYAEARGESYRAQLMVAQCVLDRLEDGTWGGSVAEVIRADGQFAEPGELTEESLEVARDALDGKRALRYYRILYFRATESEHDWHAPYLRHFGKHAVYGEEVQG